jgi:GDYXXLXY protein
MKRLFALILPLAGFAALWGWTHHRAQQGTDWDVPVQGYDPRDLLRGHYITFQYDWPGLVRADLPASGWGELCLHGRAPVIDRVSVIVRGGCPDYVRADDLGSYYPNGLVTGRLYVPQDKAAGLEVKLRNPALQGVVRFRLRDDGHITPLSIRFRPRPAEAPSVSPPQ